MAVASRRAAGRRGRRPAGLARRQMWQPRLGRGTAIPAVAWNTVRGDAENGPGLRFERTNECYVQARMILVLDPPQGRHMPERPGNDYMAVDNEQVVGLSPRGPAGDALRRHGTQATASPRRLRRGATMPSRIAHCRSPQRF